LPRISPYPRVSGARFPTGPSVSRLCCPVSRCGAFSGESSLFVRITEGGDAWVLPTCWLPCSPSASTGSTRWRLTLLMLRPRGQRRCNSACRVQRRMGTPLCPHYRGWRRVGHADMLAAKQPVGLNRVNEVTTYAADAASSRTEVPRILPTTGGGR